MNFFSIASILWMLHIFKFHSHQQIEYEKISIKTILLIDLYNDLTNTITNT